MNPQDQQESLSGLQEVPAQDKTNQEDTGGRKTVVQVIQEYFPIAKWLPYYKLSNFLRDLLSGLFLSLNHISQGMASAHLAGTPAYFGMYMGFFHELTSFLFGGVKFVSLGTASITCLQAGEVVFKQLKRDTDKIWSGQIDEPLTAYQADLIPWMSALSFAIGTQLLLFWFINVGSLARIFTPVFISAFTTGASIHILCIVLGDMLGLVFLPSPGLFCVYYSMRRIIARFNDVNVTSCIISVATVVSLLLSKYVSSNSTILYYIRGSIFRRLFLTWRTASWKQVLRPLLLKISVPFPDEFIVVIIGIGTSHGMRLTEPQPIGYGVIGIAPPPLGFELIEFPDWNMFLMMFVQGAMVGIITFAITAAKLETDPSTGTNDANRLLFVKGIANIVGACLGCLPTCTSRHRNRILEILDVRSPLAGALCALIMMIPILFLSHYMEPLPLPLLSSIEFVLNLKLFTGWCELTEYWHESKWLAASWLFTCLTTIVTDLSYGFIVGILISVRSLFHSRAHNLQELQRMKQQDSIDADNIQ